MSEQVKDDGGPAFPRPRGISQDDDGNELHNDSQRGMSLRDWFAGQAMAAMLSNPKWDPAVIVDEKRTARSAVIYADAMLAARKS